LLELVLSEFLVSSDLSSIVVSSRVLGHSSIHWSKWSSRNRIQPSYSKFTVFVLLQGLSCLYSLTTRTAFTRSCPQNCIVLEQQKHYALCGKSLNLNQIA